MALGNGVSHFILLVGLTWMRMPFFVWGMLVTAFLLLLAFPPLEVAAVLQLFDRLFGSSFFLPTGLLDSNRHLDIAGGGSPLLYQHLFWFLAHPEVYVLILPAMCIVSDIIPCNIRRPLWGHKTMIYAALVLGFFSFIVWAHHMYLTGMGAVVSTFFQITTVSISVPSVVLLTCLMISLWGGSIRFNSAMLFACAFLPMFGILLRYRALPLRRSSRNDLCTLCRYLSLVSKNHGSIHE